MSRKYFLFLWIGVFMLSGCSAERKLARQFINENKTINVLITPTNRLYKDNLTIEYDTTKYDISKQDSIAWAQSKYIKNISDSLYLTAYTNSIIKELTKNNCNVLLGDTYTQLPQSFTSPWFVEIAQLQILERYSYLGYSQTLIFDEGIRNVPVQFYELSFETWFNIKKDKLAKAETNYYKNDITDDLDVFSFGRNQRNAISTTDVYRFATIAGMQHASLLFDYFMNKYVQQHLPDKQGIRWFHYDRKGNVLKQSHNYRLQKIAAN